MQAQSSLSTPGTAAGRRPCSDAGSLLLQMTWLLLDRHVLLLLLLLLLLCLLQPLTLLLLLLLLLHACQLLVMA